MALPIGTKRSNSVVECRFYAGSRGCKSRLRFMLIASIDPGVTNGVCLVSTGPLKVHQSDQVAGIHLLMAWLDSLPGLSCIIVEDFLGSGHRTKYGLQTIETIGAVQGWAAVHGVQFVRQPPQWRKPFVKEARKMLAVRHGGRHRADALAHAMSYLYRLEKGIQ